MSNLSEQAIINKIEYIIRWKDTGDNYTREDVEVIEELYNLYQKQQKEIEKYKNVIDNGEFTWKQKYEETFEYVKENYINKDKIREKIEELIKEGDYRTSDNLEGRIHFHKEPTDYKIEVLNELLEESE